MNCGNGIKINKWSAVHIWFISYIINTHFFQGNIWTHYWPAPNVSGFIAQLVEHRTGITRSRVQNPLKPWFFFQAFLRNCINCFHCDDHFFIFIPFPQFIYDLFHISLTIQDHAQNLEEQIWMGGRREVSIISHGPVTSSNLKLERLFCVRVSQQFCNWL